jgi:hypothetical protein
MVFWDPGDGQRWRLPAVVAGAASPGPERDAFVRWRVAPVGGALGDHRDGDAGVEAGATGAAGPQRRRGRLRGARPCCGPGSASVLPEGRDKLDFYHSSWTVTELGRITVPIWRGCVLYNTKLAIRSCGVI